MSAGLRSACSLWRSASSSWAWSASRISTWSITRLTMSGTPTPSRATSPIMNAFRAIVFAAVVAGLATGLAVTVIQQFGTVPLILKAEVFEKAAADHHADASAGSGAMTVGHAHDHAEAAGAAHEHAAEAWEPRD